MAKMEKAYRFRAYPSKGTQETLNRQMYLAKEFYNLLLEKSKVYYKETKKTLTECLLHKPISALQKKNKKEIQNSAI